jgi:hypothetical protein
LPYIHFVQLWWCVRVAIVVRVWSGVGIAHHGASRSFAQCERDSGPAGAVVLDREEPFRAMLEGTGNDDFDDEDTLLAPPLVSLSQRLDRVDLAGVTPSRNAHTPAGRWLSRPRPMGVAPPVAQAQTPRRVVAIVPMPPPIPDMTAPDGSPIVATNNYELVDGNDDGAEAPPRPLPAPPLSRLGASVASDEDKTHASNVSVRSFSAADTAPLDEDIPTGEGTVVHDMAAAAVAMPALSEEGLALAGVDTASTGDLSALADVLGIMPIADDADVAWVGDLANEQTDPLLQLSRASSSLPETQELRVARAHHLYLLSLEKLAKNDLRGALSHLELACSHDPDNGLYQDLRRQTARRWRA